MSILAWVAVGVVGYFATIALILRLFYVSAQSDEISPRLRRYLAENASSHDAERQANLDGYVWIPTLHNGADTDAA